LAGEAGSLLKIEEEIRSAIEDARRQWQTLRQRPEFFDSADLAKLDKRAGVQQELPAEERALIAADLRLLTSEDFWKRIEERIYAALRDYAEQAENGGGFQRRLFAEDAARGFAFIDVCRKRYDVALMNPPFGDGSILAREYLKAAYAEEKDELYACFVNRCVAKLCVSGKVGIISSRSGLFLPRLAKWRKSLLSSTSFGPMVDLGNGVLDSALVETAAYVLNGQRGTNDRDEIFMQVLGSAERERELQQLLAAASHGQLVAGLYALPPAIFTKIPLTPFAYWVDSALLDLFRSNVCLEHVSQKVRIGFMTADDFRFLRLFWETSSNEKNGWYAFSKGGGYSPFYDDLHLVVYWDGGRIYWSVNNGGKATPPSNVWMLETTVNEHFKRPGISFTRRSTSGFAPQPLPQNALFSDMSPTVM